VEVCAAVGVCVVGPCLAPHGQAVKGTRPDGQGVGAGRRVRKDIVSGGGCGWCKKMKRSCKLSSWVNAFCVSCKPMQVTHKKKESSDITTKTKEFTLGHQTKQERNTLMHPERINPWTPTKVE